MKALLKTAAFIILCSMVWVKPKTVGERFINFANTYNTDSLETILADDFILKRNFTTFTNDRESYLINYTRNAARLHGRFDIISKTGNGNPEVFLVENSSDVFTYLLDEKAKWQLSVHTNKDKQVDVVQIDTAAGYNQFKQRLIFVQSKFDKWLSKAHPDESPNMLVGDTTGLYTRRLIEFQHMYIEE